MSFIPPCTQPLHPGPYILPATFARGPSLSRGFASPGLVKNSTLKAASCEHAAGAAEATIKQTYRELHTKRHQLVPENFASKEVSDRLPEQP